MNVISSDSLSKTYKNGLGRRNEIKALDAVTLSIESGQIFALLGPNGAGKTTFIKLLLSIAHPSFGGATVLGRPIPNVEVRRRIGYLPENHRYPGYLSGTEVLTYFGRLARVPYDVLRERIPQLMEIVGLSARKDHKVKTYSKGMLQRLGLAQALINDPDLIFLDEPTEGVDPVGRKEIRDVLQSLSRQGKTLFLNSHILSEVELISDRLAILDRGKLVREGTVEEFTSAESQVEIRLTAEPPEAFSHAAAATLMRLEYAAHSLTAHISTPAELNRLIDLLRAYQCEIVSITKKKTTLEDSFLKLIRREVSS